MNPSQPESKSRSKSFEFVGRMLGGALRLLPFRRMGTALLAFLCSRRWLYGGVALSVLLLGVLATLKPHPHEPVYVPADPAVVFDDVQLASANGQGPPLHFRSSTRNAEEGSKLQNAVASLETPVTDEDAEPPEPLRLTRRLNEVRARQAKGAWLIGTIDTVADAASARPLAAPHVLPNESATRSPAPVIRAMSGEVAVPLPR